MKKITSVSIDDDLLKKAQEAGFNISGEFESAMQKRLNIKEVAIPIKDPDACNFCGKKEDKATRDNLIGLTWLEPDGVWICAECLDEKVRQITISYGRPNVMALEKKKRIQELAREFVNQPEIRKNILNQAKKKITG